MLINCTAYSAGHKRSDVDVATAGEFMKEADEFIWAALQDPGAQELEKLERHFGLPKLAVEDALHGHQRPKIEEYDHCLFVVVHLIEADDSGELQLGELAIFAGTNYLVSVRRGASHGFLDVRARTEREPELLRLGSGYVLYALVDAVVDRYFPIIEQLEAELDIVEAEIFGPAGPGRANVERLYALKQKTTLVKHAIEPLLHDIGKLHGGRVPSQVNAVQDYIRDVADHLSRISSSIEGLRDTIGTAVQVNLSLVTIRDGEVMKRLAAWAAIFAVCTAFAGLWGMNFEAMPELKWTYGYPFALAVIVGSCSALYYRFRKTGWL